MVIVQSRDNPAAVRNAIVDLIPADLCEIRVASAYVTRGGAELLFGAVRDLIGQANFDAVPKMLITSFDYGLTQPEALSFWSGMQNATVYVAGAEMLQLGSLTPRRAFHPKIYSFGSGGTQSCNTLVGSANLTGRGFSVNTEAVFAQYQVFKPLIDNAFSVILRETIPLSDFLLEQYASLRWARPAPIEIRSEAEPLPLPQTENLENLLPFKQAIESGFIHPENFTSMWIKGDALQGGSRNQLELPRGANKFFGFNFERYDYLQNITIGTPSLRSGYKVWNDKPLTWHGNNRMERINLPTINQGGFDYSNSAVMFRRLFNGSFELVVVPWHSDLACSWIEASAARGTLFRLGQGATSRVVGLL
ncbi:phospholipase D family protein [Pseudomonas lijiangensis]|uniref:hypothetical protein n=1 Tax=Pseudomonas lijiangensis TaxID=2995658 RepID=UPI0034D97346